MAPLRPLPSKAAAPPKSILKQTTSTRKDDAEALFANSKRDKQRIKHARLLSKVSKSANTKQRRRRPNKKLVATLDSLTDALPSDAGEDSATNQKDIAGLRPEDQVNIIKRRSMKSRPGAMKRKQRLDNDERDRFAKNLAQMAAPVGEGIPASAADKMRALRSFIAQTLETRPEMLDEKSG